MRPGKVLISGASLAGPALAYWLHTIGWDVTIVERSRKLRLGGYPIDVRGSAAEIAVRMGIHEKMVAERQRHLPTQILRPDGRLLTKFSIYDLTASVNSIDVELPRGALTRILYDLTKDAVEYVFGDSVTALTETPDGIDAEFQTRAPERFDIVVGADGIHSTTRRLLFGPEEDYIRHLGPLVAIWDLQEGVVPGNVNYVYSNAGRTILADVPESGTGRMFATFLHPDPGSVDISDPQVGVDLVRHAFRDDRWNLSRPLVDTIASADDVFFDTVSQVRMDSWHRGRAVLVGDAAFAPAFLSGQGTSIALMGAYVLASEIANRATPEAAFSAYGDKLRPFVEKNQALALRPDSAVMSRSEDSLRARNKRLKKARWIVRLGLSRLLTRHVREASNDFDVADYGLQPVTQPARQAS